MRRAKRLLIAGGIACGLVACNLIAGFESAYSVGGTSGTPGEGGLDGPDPDAPVDPDARTDAPLDGTTEASKPFRCEDLDAAVTIFCDDFEAVTGPTFGFPTTESTVDASYMLATRSGSTSKVLRVSLTSPGGADKRTWLNGKPLITNPQLDRHFELELDFRVADSTLDYAALALLTFASGPEREHGIAIEGATALVRLQQPYPDNVPQNKDHWFHAKVTLDREDSGTTFFRKVLIQNLTTGGPVVEVDDGTPDLDAPSSGGIEVRIGIFNTSPDDGGVTAEFDNVVVRRW